MVANDGRYKKIPEGNTESYRYFSAGQENFIFFVLFGGFQSQVLCFMYPAFSRHFWLGQA
jgi:hypothetical protein